MKKFLLIFAVFLAGCASAPKSVNNACAIFDQRDGWVNNWHKDAKKAERDFGVPIPIMMATIYTESSFQPYARPPRTKLLGFIPWKRQSSAYGYSQALDGTWARYTRETGRYGASRTNFGDAIHFVGWYHKQSNISNGISLNDPYNLYLAYYSGHGGYAKGSWRGNAMVQRAAKKATNISQRYAAQLRNCGSM